MRLVGDGRTHYHAGNTYSPTPSKEEFLVLLHMIAALDWDYVLVDEKRAFLNAKYKGESKVFAKLRGDNKYYEVLGALYGLKTSPRDYNSEVVDRLISMGFTRLQMCSCIFVKRDTEAGTIVIIYDFVDDFFGTSNSLSALQSFVTNFRKIVSTTDPEWIAPIVLGMEIRNFSQNDDENTGVS